MNLNEQHDIVKLTRRIESLEAKVYGGKSEKIAVRAPKKWMKEIVAKIWGVYPVAKKCKSTIPDSYPYVFKDGNYIDAHDRKDHAEDDGYTVISFKYFCKQHGISDKPDYVWFDGKILPTQILEYRLCVQIPGTFKYAFVENNRAATEKEYLEQEWKELEGFEMDEPPKKEPELKLHDDWNKEIEKDRVHNGWDYLMGVEDMQKAIYDRACEIYAYGTRGWDSSCAEAINDAIHGKLKPPNQ